MSATAGPISIPALREACRLTQFRVGRSEWTKLYSLRSTRWSLLAATVLTIGLPVLFATVLSTHWSHMSPRDRAEQHPLDVALAGVNISQLPIAVLGALVITGEYSTGMIRASFMAVPRRLPVLWAKAAVYAVVTLALMLPSVWLAFYGSQLVLRHHHILQISASHSGVARAISGGAIYLTLVAVLALAIGASVRNTAGGISAFAALFFVIPPLLSLLPRSWDDAINPYLPSEAGRSIFSLTHDAHSLAPGPGLALFAAYTAVALAIAAVLLVRRDV